ncbi:MAG: rhomboid family intramembrane serine protease [Pseudomonadota bacterium]
MINDDDRENAKVTRFPDPKERKKAMGAGEPVLNLPPVVKALCLINIAVFLFGKAFPNLLTEETLYALAFMPARYSGAWSFGFSEIFSPVTHLFLHGGWMHLAINTGTLMAFGAGLEKKIGGRRLLLLYFASGLCGALAHVLVYPGTDAPLIGASGAISGLFGGILLLMQSEGMMGQGTRKFLFFIFIWMGVSIFFGFFGVPGTENPIAWTAHIGGFVGGLLLYRPISRLRL